MAVKPGSTVVVAKEHLQGVLDALLKRDYLVAGPVARSGVISYEPVTSVTELPEGWTDEQEGGKYRLVKNGGGKLFGYISAAQSWKRVLFPSERRMWSVRRDGKSFAMAGGAEKPGKAALLGVRACELSAILVQDRVLMWDRFSDPLYAARRRNLFIAAVNCGRAGGTCFCESMGTGPKAESGYDIALTEISGDGRHYFMVEVGTEAGAGVMSEVEVTEAGDAEKAAAAAVIAAAAGSMGRKMDTSGIKELLFRNFENPRWQQVATRCLSCGNCTMVCPTCFCTAVEDRTSLDGNEAERRSLWDSCFTLDYSRIAGGIIRQSVSSRYRQWLVHKLAAWHDQFGSSGCVGCGRCITWCPVGIDLTEEAAAIRESDGDTMIKGEN